jgi:hypothetical protein
MWMREEVANPSAGLNPHRWLVRKAFVAEQPDQGFS